MQMESENQAHSLLYMAIQSMGPFVLKAIAGFASVGSNAHIFYIINSEIVFVCLSVTDHIW